MKKARDYLISNKKLSRLDTRLYYFLKSLYQIMITPTPTKDSILNLYQQYINIINLSFGLNGEEPKKYLIEKLFKKLLWLLDREKAGPHTFILLNHHGHYLFLKSSLVEIKDLSDLDGYADEVEFKKAIQKIKIRFDEKFKVNKI